MSAGGLVKVVSKFASDNAPAILAGTAVAGVVGTAVAVGKGTWQAAEDIRAAELRHSDQFATYIMPTKDRVQLVWKRYIPAAAVAGTTVVCIIAGATVSGRRNAALIAAYSVSESMFAEYKDKVVEQLGENKEQKVRDAIAQDHIDQNPWQNREVVFAGTGEVPCYEAITGRWFYNTAENIRQAQNKINLTIINNMYVSLNEYFGEIGLEPVGMGDELGWNNATPLEIQFSSILDDKQIPALHLGYRHLPVPNYDSNH